jgi:ribosomal protein L20A (L18A)
MKFKVKGNANGRAFAIEVEARSEKHAKDVAHAQLSTRQGINRSRIEISSVEKA